MIQLIEKRIKELNKADVAACEKRWDMKRPKLERDIWRCASNEVTFARQELERLLKQWQNTNYGWFKPNESMPLAEYPIIACCKNSLGKTRRVRACYIPRFYISTEDNYYIGDDEYNEDEDMSYWPEGWYEWNEVEETHWKISMEIICWTHLPAVPKEFTN